jgi:tetratricopeptide (TPR) repeat protein
MASAFSGCAGTQNGEAGGRSQARATDSTVFHVPASIARKPPEQRFFQAYQSGAGWGIFAVGPVWVEVPGERGGMGIPARILVRGEDRKLRVSLFETAWPKGRVKEKEIWSALAYLFKADPDSEETGEPQARMRLFRPPDTLNHWGLLLRSDSTLVFINVESKTPLAGGDLGRLPDLRLEFDAKRRGGAPDSCQSTFRGALENTLGLKAVEDSNWNLGLRHFQSALELDSANPAYLVNCAAMFQVKRENLEGIAFLSRHNRLVASASDLSGIMGALYEDLGRYGEAKDWAMKALELDPGNVEWLINLSDALWGLGERVHSKNVLLRMYSEKPSFRLSVYLAQTYLGLEEYENARQVLVQAHADSAPSDKSVEYYLRAMAGLKDYEGALDYTRDLGAAFPRTSNNYLLKGNCEFNLKLYRLAGQSAKTALELDPSNRDAQQLATQVSALMGSRSNLILRTPIAPLKTKTTLAAARDLLQKTENQQLAAQAPLTLAIQDVVYAWSP